MARVLGKLTVALTGVVLAVIASPSCSDGTVSTADCDYVVTRCATYCDYCYGGGYYGSYGYGCCYDRCWYQCVGDGKPDRPPNVDPPPASTTPAPTPAPADGGGASASDGGAVAPGNVAVLCAPCKANDECKGGGLCILRGGEDAGTPGFCGTPCGSSADCPAEFTCTEIGQSKQCVPSSGACN